MTVVDLAVASAGAFFVAFVSAVAGFGGGVLALPLFTGLFGLRVAVPVLTLTQLASNASRVWFNRAEIGWSIVRRFAVGAVPCAIAGGLLFASAPLAALQRVIGLFLILVVLWRRWRPHPRHPTERVFVGVGAATGFGSALVGSVGPLVAPFFLALGLTRGAYIGTEAACALVVHTAKLIAYGASALLTGHVLVLGLVLTPATVAGAWVGKRVVDRISEDLFTTLVEAGLVIAGTLFLIGV